LFSPFWKIFFIFCFMSINDEGWHRQPYMIDLESRKKRCARWTRWFIRQTRRSDNDGAKLGLQLGFDGSLHRLLPAPFIGGWVPVSWSSRIHIHCLSQFTISLCKFFLIQTKLRMPPGALIFMGFSRI
jgi:hypothetical protein